MPKISEQQKERIRESIRYANMIRKRLHELDTPLPEQTETLAISLGEMREQCFEYLNILGRLFSPEAEDKQYLAGILKHILYDFEPHIRYHMDGAKGPLFMLINSLEGAPPDEDAKETEEGPRKEPILQGQ